MPDRFPHLHCDEDVSLVLAAMLRARGFTVTTARDSGQLGRSDEEQLTFARDTGSVFVTHNASTSSVFTAEDHGIKGASHATMDAS